MNALLLVGSPKGQAGTSHAVGEALFRRLEAGGMAVEETTAAAALASDEGRERFLGAVEAADLVVVSFPLYVDQLPAPLIRALELVAERRKGAPGVRSSAGRAAQRIAAIVQCGFPETHQNQPALDILRHFAAEAGFRWSGALAMGMGGAIGRRPLDKPKGMLRSVVKALDLAAASLAAGNDIPAEASEFFGKPLMGKWLYLLAANLGMKRQARKHGVSKQVYDRPYAA